jgi:hypothetical protein
MHGDDRSPLASFLAAAPAPQRIVLRTLLALAVRRRGRALLASSGPLHQLAVGLLGLGRYDEPALAHSLGWDAEAVVRRGRELRRAEGRP